MSSRATCLLHPQRQHQIGLSALRFDGQERHRHEPVPSHAHLISWAGICPRNDESAGKRRSNRLRKGAPWLKTTLVQCAWASLPPSTTCSRTGRRTTTSAVITSITVQPISKNNAWLNASLNLATLWRSSRSPARAAFAALPAREFVARSEKMSFFLGNWILASPSVLASVDEGQVGSSIGSRPMPIPRARR